MSKIENLKANYERALAKKIAIEANSLALETKKKQIEVQLERNAEKIRRINFFLEETSKALQGKIT